MQTLRNHESVELIQWPRPEEWADNPLIKFSVDQEQAIATGDRILVTTKMVTSGQVSGSITDIYYYIQDLVDRDHQPLDRDGNLPVGSKHIITALAKRMEL